MRKIGIMLLLPCLLFSGCLKSVELKDRGIVQSIGVDFDGETYQVYMQIFSSSGGEGGSAFDKGKENNKVISGQGKTVHAAIREAGDTSGKIMFMGNLKMILIGNETAREGIKEIIDYFDSDFQTRGKTKILICEKEAKEIVEAKSDKEKLISADDVSDILRTNQKTGYVGRSNILLAETSFYNGTPNGFLLDRIRLQEEGETKKVVIDGAALIKGDKMVDLLSKEEVHGSSWMKNNMQWSIVTAESSDIGNFSVIVKNSSKRIIPKVEGDTIAFYIDVDISANLTEAAVDKLSEDLSVSMETIQEAVEKQVEKEMSMAINKSIYRNGCDIFNLNKYVKIFHSPLMDTIGENWDEKLREVEIYTKVKCNIKRTMVLGNAR